MTAASSRFLDPIVAYYDHTWFDYRFVWLNPENLAIHFGYHDDRHRRHRHALANMNRILADVAGITSGTRVLDAGCGIGGSTLWLAQQRSARVTGVTPVQSQLVRARGGAERRGLQARVAFVRGDYHALAFPDESFDVVWALESLCHSPDKPRVYRELSRVLRPGGRLVVAEYIRAARPLSPRSERVLSQWLSGWMIPDIDTPAEHRAAAGVAGLCDIVLRDVTRYTLPSLRRLYLASFLGVPIDRALQRRGLRNEVQHGNVVGSRRQYEALQRCAWFYGILSARKGGAPERAGA